MEKAEYHEKDGYRLTEGHTGFTWGPITVVRLFDTPEGCAIEVQGDRQTVQIWATPTGLVRIGKLRKTKHRYDP